MYLPLIATILFFFYRSANINGFKNGNNTVSAKINFQVNTIIQVCFHICDTFSITFLGSFL